MPKQNSPKVPKVRTLKDQMLDVHEVEIELNQGVYGPVERVVLKTNVGAITYKPHGDVEEEGRSMALSVNGQRNSSLISVSRHQCCGS